MSNAQKILNMLEKTQADHMRALGKREGELDCLSSNRYTTIEDRADQAFIQMGLKTFRKQFIQGYVAGAKGVK